MEKYRPLRHFLSSLQPEIKETTSTFAELERILGRPLPGSARIHRPWWANGGHSQANAWLNAGWKTAEVDMLGERICFRRIEHRILPTALGSREILKEPRKVPPEVLPLPDIAGRQLTRSSYTFHFVCDLLPETGANGEILTYRPQDRYVNGRMIKLHKYGEGEFCRIRIPVVATRQMETGVYAVTVDGNMVYIGECEDLQDRWNIGYGQISPRNCYEGGQPTNCRVNKCILEAARVKKTIALWFYETLGRKTVEAKLRRLLNPVWNRV